MTRVDDGQVAAQAVEALNGEVEALDAVAVQRLKQARRNAVSAAGSRNISTWMWATAATAAAALVLAIGLGDFNGNGAPNDMLAQQVLAEPELYEEMEFYLWLSAELETE